MIIRNPEKMNKHPKHKENAVNHHGEPVRYCDSCGDWLLYNGEKGCIRCDKPWREK